MVPSPMSSFTVDFWQTDPVDNVEVYCLMPNGILITMKAHPTSTIRDIKEDLWVLAKSYPLYERLQDQSMYIISAISAFANIDQFSNESKRLCDIQPYFCILLLSERDESTELSPNRELNKTISCIIGRCVDDFRTFKNPEVNDFRYKMSLLGEKHERQRSKMTWDEKFTYQYPIRLASSPEVPRTLRGRLRNDVFLVIVKQDNDDVSKFTFCVSYYDPPSKVIDAALSKIDRVIKTNHMRSDYVLNINGTDEFIFGEFPLVQFLYIQEMLSNEEVPVLVLKLKAHIEISPIFLPESNAVEPDRLIPKIPKHHSSWNIQEPFQLHVHSIENINCDLNKTMELGVLLGLFHGNRKLCATKKIGELSVSNIRNVDFETTLTFEINLDNIPRMARLCLVIYQTAKSGKLGGSRARRVNKDSKDKYMNPIAWTNTTVFDYKHQLRNGLLTLYSWTYGDDIQSDDIFYSRGTVEQNPRTDECTIVKLTFHDYDRNEVIMYPHEDTVLQHARRAQRKSLNRDSAQDTRTIGTILQPYLYNRRLYEMHDQERNAIWAKRMDCLVDAPEELSILLHCVNWNQREEVAEIWSLLRQWKKISIPRALELLDYTYPDYAVRHFAVKCLRDMSHEDLKLYLTQLVQTIKHELYLESDLVRFLLERAFSNQLMGHYFFWQLRSELHSPSVQLRFGLILEAYLKGSRAHVPSMIGQMDSLERLRQGSDLVKSGHKDKARPMLHEFLSKEINSSVFVNTVNPLNPSYRFRSIRTEKCKVMDSKMRPLWLVFENAHNFNESICIIFKNGDDLRQDMFTLQMLKFMDRIWKDAGYDFRLSPYNVISMDKRLGMIEVILNAETIANIQKEKGGKIPATASFRKGTILDWLKDHNKDEQLEKAISEFTFSCAGYCVATYVLGIADRHSDNIMVTRSGQLVHIDFGHILGHFKEKFGVRRERVPFVLTHDFVYVINKGRTDQSHESEEFKHFRKLCETAFLILRANGNLIISMFSMMISTGLPELSSEKDLKYLAETLVLDLNEEKAKDHFKSKFNEALGNSWKTSVNWATHYLAKSNNQKS